MARDDAEQVSLATDLANLPALLDDSDLPAKPPMLYSDSGDADSTSLSDLIGGFVAPASTGAQLAELRRLMHAELRRSTKTALSINVGR